MSEVETIQCFQYRVESNKRASSVSIIATNAETEHCDWEFELRHDAKRLWPQCKGGSWTEIERERVEVYLLSQYDKRAKCTCFSSFPFCHDLAFYTATQPNASEIGFVFRVFGLNGSLFSAAVYCRISALFRFWGCFCRQRRRFRYRVSLLTDSFDRWCIRIICVSLCIPLRRWCFMPFEIYTHTHSVFVRRIRWASYQFVVSSFYRLVFHSH